jgi:hypothetical protein
LANVWSWNPADFEDHKVDLLEVAYTVRQAYQLYQFEGCVYDFWQCEHMAQELMTDRIPMCPTKLGREDLDLIVRSLLDSFASRRIALFPHAALEKDLLRLRVKEKPQGGYKLDSVRDEAGGHADRAVAMSFCLPAALRIIREHAPMPRDEYIYA